MAALGPGVPLFDFPCGYGLTFEFMLLLAGIQTLDASSCPDCGRPTRRLLSAGGGLLGVARLPVGPNSEPASWNGAYRGDREYVAHWSPAPDTRAHLEETPELAERRSPLLAHEGRYEGAPLRRQIRRPQAVLPDAARKTQPGSGGRRCRGRAALYARRSRRTSPATTPDHARKLRPPAESGPAGVGVRPRLPVGHGGAGGDRCQHRAGAATSPPMNCSRAAVSSQQPPARPPVSSRVLIGSRPGRPAARRRAGGGRPSAPRRQFRYGGPGTRSVSKTRPLRPTGSATCCPSAHVDGLVLHVAIHRFGPELSANAAVLHAASG